MRPITISATTISDAWFQTVYKCVEIGRRYKIHSGSFSGSDRLQFDFVTIHIKFPGADPMLPEIPVHYNIPNPVAPDYINDYLPKLMTPYKSKNESYTYGERLTKSKISGQKAKWLKEKNHEIINPGYFSNFLNQIEYAIEVLKSGTNTNQMCLQIAEPTDLIFVDPPCLRHIDTMIIDGKLNFFPYFRSWDLWSGFPANLQAIEYLKQYMASEIGVENGEIIASSKGLHLYDYTWELSEIIRGKSIDEFKNGFQQ